LSTDLTATRGLDKPFKAIATFLELGYHLSPRAMRRSVQDLARAASVSDIVTRAISGHHTEPMRSSTRLRRRQEWSYGWS